MVNVEHMTDEEFSRFMDESLDDDGVVIEETIEVDNVETTDDSGNDEEEIEVDGTEDLIDESVDEGSESSAPIEEVSEPVDDTVPTESIADKVETPIVDEPVVTEPATWKIKADGIDFELTEKELTDLASKGINYTKKMQKMKPYSTIISSIEENKISKDELDLLISAYKGDKGAINEIIKKNNVDTFELEPEVNTYRPVSYGKSEVELEMLDVIGSIKADEEYKITEHVISNLWDEKSKAMIYNSFTDSKLKTADGRTYLEGLHQDIKDGTYDKLAPVMMKKKILDNNRKSDLEYYWEAARDMAEKERLEGQARAREEAIRAEERAKYEAQLQQSQKAISPAASAAMTKNRKAAGITKSGGGATPIKNYLDISGMSDDEFLKLMDEELRK